MRYRACALAIRALPEEKPRHLRGFLLLPPPALGERRHRGLARHRVDGDSFHTKAPASPWGFLQLAPPKYRVHSGVALSEERTVSLILYYLAFMIGGDLVAYFLGLLVEYEWGKQVSLIVFLALYFFSLWVAWMLAVWVTTPRGATSSAS